MKKIFILFYCSFFIFILSMPKDLFSQNVGIGTTTPTEKLHVAGNIKADTVKPNAIKLTPNAGAGKILTSDASGNASWQLNSAAAATGFGIWGDCASNANITEYSPVVDTAGAPLDGFGSSVSISGNYAIIGAYQDDVGANTDQGSASIYQYNGSAWVFMQKITDASGVAFENFGNSVSISGNYAVVGAYGDNVGANTAQGSASIYQLSGSTWTLMQKITDATGAALDAFGVSVSISGNYVIAGAWNDDGPFGTDQGSASIYQLTGGVWVLMNKITDATGAINDFFGKSVSISGNYAMVGAYRDDVGANSDQGSASIYQYNGSNWVLMEKITDPTGSTGDFFGGSVSISGNLAIAGANGDDVVFTDQGSASIYQYNGSNWIFIQQIVDPTGASNDFFGSSVCLSGNYAIIGAYRDDAGVNTDQGSATIFVSLGPVWQRLQRITDPSGNANDFFGFATAIDNTNSRFLIGAIGYGGSSGKAVFGKMNN